MNEIKENNYLNFDQSQIKIINRDCFDEITKIPNHSIDLILSDPPYGMTKNSWDKPIDLNKLWLEYNRIIKDNGIIILFGNQPFTSKLILSNLDYFRYSLVWEKNKFSDFLNAKKKVLKIHEDICIFYKKTGTYNPQYHYKTPYLRNNKQESIDKQTNYNSYKECNIIESKDGKRYPTSVLKFNRVERPQHSCQKPVDLIEWLVKTYSNKNDIVLDNFMGAGTTAVACKKLNRKCIGMEIEEKYYKITQERINAVLC
jgi:site-specific DNA-methyltransferase (adenine-specific)